MYITKCSGSVQGTQYLDSCYGRIYYLCSYGHWKVYLKAISGSVGSYRGFACVSLRKAVSRLLLHWEAVRSSPYLSFFLFQRIFHNETSLQMNNSARQLTAHSSGCNRSNQFKWTKNIWIWETRTKLFCTQKYFTTFLLDSLLLFPRNGHQLIFIFESVLFRAIPMCYRPMLREEGARPQCDQMSRVVFNIWPFPAMKISSIAYKNGHKCCQILNLPSKNC